MKFIIVLSFLFLVFLPVFCPETGHAEATVKKQEYGKDDLDFLRKILEPGTDKHINPKNKIQQDHEPGKIPGEFLHAS